MSTTRSRATKVASHAAVTATTAPGHAAHAHAATTKASPATAPATPAPAAPPAPPAFIAPPPASANIPSVPDGFEPTNGASYRGTQPRTTELVALPLAVRDLANFTNYASVIGATAPPLDEVQQTFAVTNEWSTMRNASSAWDDYSRDQEGIAWTVMRSVMDRLKPAFELAAKTNPSIATSYAGLAALLGAKSASAKKAVATKKKNKQDLAEGKVPTAGQVGKAREKAAAKAALAAQQAAKAQQATTASAPGAVAVAAPVAVQAAVAPASSAQAPTAVAAAPANGGTPGPNGAPHS